MKKKCFSFLCIIFTMLLSFTVFSGCSLDKPTTLKKIKLNEVVRSVFYAPMYAAITEGFFEKEGLAIDVSTGQGAEGTIVKTQVL